MELGQTTKNIIRNGLPITDNVQKLPKAALITAKPGVKGRTEVEATGGFLAISMLAAVRDCEVSCRIFWSFKRHQ